MKSINIDKYIYVDVHCHLYEYPEPEIEELTRETLIFAVSDDYTSSIRTLELSRKYKNVVPGIGIHPWEIGINVHEDEVAKIVGLIEKEKIVMIGEVGLDSRFRKETLELQEKILRTILEASPPNIIFNVHALGTWGKVFELLTKFNVKVAIFHWYSGPSELLRELEAQGYYISVNPSIEFQRKHRDVVRQASLDIILTESDGPYRYRGRMLSPRLIPLTINILSRVKEMSEEEVVKVIQRNTERILKSVNLI